MKLDKLVGERFKEKPADASIDSHALMLRGGYMKYVANGIFSSFLPLRRITHKIENIIRQEMDAIDGQEVQFPVVLPASLWEESGRYESVGQELLRFTDRNDVPMVLGMTHEEAAVQLVREYGQSYNKYPFMIYQLQTKFRDEARPRGGLIRVREFTMKDAYSFHTSQQDLEAYYERCYEAYNRIYARAGIPEVITVASDSGMMGGSLSHEYMLLTPVGEDSIAICTECDYRANLEVAENILPPTDPADESQSLTLVHTPGMQTIEDVSGFLNLPKEQACKAVVYQRESDDKYVILFLRGDLEANESKITKFIGDDIYPASDSEGSGLCFGYIGPNALSGDHILLYDRSLENMANLFCGANQPEHHYTGLDFSRDVGSVQFHDFAKILDGGICPQCGKATISISRGIEVGNIFQLGDKYSASMDMKYLDENGQSHHPIMGCYGIGVGRLAASVCEAHHDEYGPIWPISIAPWQVHLCCIRSDNPEAKQFADGLYNSLQRQGIEVIYDDRQVSAGFMFSDADLLGVPIRVVVSPRNLKEDCCEISLRDKSFSNKVPTAEIETAIKELITKLEAQLQP